MVTSFLQRNVTMLYPFRDKPVSTDGLELEDDIFVDASFSGNAAQVANVSLIQFCASEALVTVSFASEETAFAGSFRQPVQPYVPYKLYSLRQGLHGSITFGPGIERLHSVFRVSARGLVDMLAIRPTPNPGVRRLRYGGDTVTGLVRFTAAGDLRAEADADTDEIELTLTNASDYAPSCDEVCKQPVIRSINGAVADSNGVITLRFV